MRPRLLSLIIVIAGLIVSSRSVNAATFCVTDEFAQAVPRAEKIFSGRIIHIEPVQTSTAASRDHVVTFQVEIWWKGKLEPEARVLWRSSILDCPLFPVGEVGEDYLVYADRTRDRFPEVTMFNRTGRLPANLKSESVLINDWGKQSRLSPRPELNRADASEDTKLLRALRQCECL